MSDPMPTVRSILGMPDFSAPVTPIRPQSASCPTAVQYLPPPVFENDDPQAAGDDHRDRLDGWRPDDKDLA